MNSSRIIVTTNVEEKVGKYNLTRRTVKFHIKMPPKNVDPKKWIEEACDEIVLLVSANLKPSDKVGFSFKIENKRDGWLPFREASKITTSDVWNILQTVMQSDENAVINDKFYIVACSVAPPLGSGPPRGRRYNTFEEECLMRRGIVTIKNNDNLCLPRALVVATARIENDPDYKKIRNDTRKLQATRAMQLLEEAGVSIPEEGCGIPELQKFQEHLRNYNITVYSYGAKGRDVVFKSDFANRKRINLLLHNNHYNVINSETSAFCCSYYCEKCNVPYNNKDGHSCNSKCPCCFQSTVCPIVENTMSCVDCRRKFRGTNCFENHKANICGRYQKCHDCLKTFKSGTNHTCGYKRCKTCYKIVPQTHMCCMQVDKKSSRDGDTLFVFYDLETTAEGQYDGDRKLEPNLCVYEKRCNHCVDEEESFDTCDKCGFRIKVLADDVIPSFMNEVLKLRKTFKKVVVIAHNGQAFDHQFVLNHILTKTSLILKKIIMRGSKILLMTLGNVIFLDSLNYFPMALRQLPKAFDLPPSTKKGYFPHLFNTGANQRYQGTLPDMKYYGPDAMKPQERDEFIKWYEKNKYCQFNFQDELVEYCKSDVRILAQACMKFRSMFLSECNVCPFTEACTIASACNKVFRRNFLKPNTIGIIPKSGYRCRDKQSKVAIEWLVYEESVRKIEIQHAAKGREVVLNGVKVDGYASETNEVYEFHGCYYHGCPKCYTDDVNMILKFQTTKNKSDRLRSSGFTVIEMWECEFDRKSALKLIQKHPLLLRTPLDPRDAFYGGRTGNVREYYKCEVGEKIKYLDVCSLYPWVCKYGKFPLGHPRVLVGDQELPANGLVKCRILPPQDLYHPVLPTKMHNKLMFVVCRSCGEEMSYEECNHNEDERALTGTWVVDEVRKALANGYIMMEVYESWIYAVTQRGENGEGLFTGMMNKFIKTKQEASGWPRKDMTQEEKDTYVMAYLMKEGIQLDPEKVQKNSGLRSLAKLMLNSFWGKFGQRDNLSKTTIINSPHEFYKMMFNSPQVIVNTIVPINDEKLLVNWENREEVVDEQSNANVCIAAYVTAQARLKLYSYLEQLGERVIYYDTDSVIFISRVGLPEPQTGNYLGDLTDELLEYGDGSYIKEFVSGGPKNYAYIVDTGDEGYHTVCKVKGIKLDYKTSELVNFESMKSMILDKDCESISITSTNFRRTDEHRVIAREETKTYRINSMKRKFKDLNSVPYGFKKMPRS